MKAVHLGKLVILYGMLSIRPHLIGQHSCTIEVRHVHKRIASQCEIDASSRELSR